MTVENDFLVWAAAGGNVQSQAAYEANSALANGFVTGIAPSAPFNKIWRQATIISAMIAKFIVDQTGQPAIDDGTIATLEANFIAAIGATVRTKLLAAGNVYVNNSTGNDVTGNGTSGLPWATQQHAANVVQSSYDLNGQVMTINVEAGTGTYTAGVQLSGPIVGSTGPGSLIIKGASSGTTAVSIGSGNCFVATNGAQFTVNGFTLTASGSGNVGNAIVAESGTQVAIGSDIVFGVCGNNHISAQNAGQVTGSSYSITGGALAHWNESKGIIVVGGGTITLTGTPAFSVTFANGALGGLIESVGETFTGSATTPSNVRYNVALNSVIYTNGQAGTYFPGTGTTGATATGGQYG